MNTFYLFHDGGPYHIQWTGFYMIETSFMKELKSKGRKNVISKIPQNSQEKVSLTDPHILTDVHGSFLKWKCNKHVMLFMGQ